MSLGIIQQKNSFDILNHAQNSLRLLEPIDILCRPVERIKRVTQAESDIASIMKQSLTHQYESFELKFNTFKELLTTFKQKISKDLIELN